MYYIKIENIDTKEEQTIYFEDREQAILYRNYHCTFDAWDKKEMWVVDKFLNPNFKKLIVEEKTVEQLNSKKEKISITYYKIKPLYRIIADNLEDTEKSAYWNALRNERNQVLKNTDMTMLSDFPLTTKERGIYREYRDYLRNLPLNYNDSSIDRFNIMNFQEWKEFFRK